MKITVVSLFLCLTGSLLAQEPSPSATPDKPPLPPAPILHRAPDLAKWTISFDAVPPAKDAPAPKPAADPGKDPANKVHPHRITVIKSGKIYLEIEEDAQGQRWEKWNTSGREVSFLSGSSKWLFSDGGTPGMFYTNYLESDFPDLYWISAKNYVAFTKVGDAKYFIFRDKLLPPGARDTVEVSAAVDSATQLPVNLSIGGTMRTYHFEKPPETPLTLPENVQSIFSQQARAAAPLLRRPGRT